MKDWCKWLSQSLEKCENHEETVEVLHTLTILVNNFGYFDGVLATLNENCSFAKNSVTKEPVLFAEAALISSILHSGDTSDSSSDQELTSLVVQHARELDENPYFMGAIISFFATRGGKDSRIADLVRTLPHPENCVKNMTKLAKGYSAKSFLNVSFVKFPIYANVNVLVLDLKPSVWLIF
jgi:hypothetical protein